MFGLAKELEQMEIPGSSADGSVVVFMTGNQEPLRVEINEAAAAKSAPELSQLVTEAMKNAYFVSKQHMEQKMEKLTSELNIPGM